MEKSYINSNGSEILLDDLVLKQKKLELVLDLVRKKIGLDEKEVNNYLNTHQKSGFILPVSIFSTKLSTLEALSLYLKDNLNIKFADIARNIKRDQRTIWHAYKRAKEKDISITIKNESLKIPLSVFANRDLSLLESLVSYLIKTYDLQLKEVAKLLNLNSKTVWTANDRAKKKQR